MTSPSLKKHPITRRSTLRSACSSLVVRAVAGQAIVAIAALTSWSAEAVSTGPKPSVAGSSIQAPPEEAGDETPASRAAAPRKRSAKTVAKEVPASPVEILDAPVAAPRRKTARSSVTQAAFQPDLSPVPDNGPGLTIRPFRKIADIVPYDNYEPDPELASKDHCNNLCPRPQGGDCPDCNKDGDGNSIPCPECPWEQELRRIGRAPGEPDRPFVPRDFAHIHYCWEPTNLYHNPIYFEDVGLERYGHTRNYFLIQPAFSIARFGVQLFGLPYQMSIYPVWDRQYSLGYYRPGEFAPYKYHQIPLNAKAAIVEAGVISGAYFLFAPGVGP